jgi:DnaK suppressor protein
MATMPETAANLDIVRSQLEEERQRIEGELEQLHREVSETVRPSTSGRGGEQAPDEASAAPEQERVLSLIHSLEYELHEVNNALERIGKGGYGLCQDCGQPIPAERLLALPQATLCVSCKSKRERGR